MASSPPMLHYSPSPRRFSPQNAHFGSSSSSSSSTSSSSSCSSSPCWNFCNILGIKHIWENHSLRAHAMGTAQGNVASPKRVSNVKYEPDHLLVLVHGIMASPSDWTYVEAELKRRLGRNIRQVVSMAHQLGSLSAETETLSQVLSLVEAFRAFDADNDGSITAAELGGIMSSLGYNLGDGEVNAMMRQGDTNRDGLLSIEEFLELNTKELGLGNLATSLKEAFQALDFDEDNVVTGEELFQAVRDNGVQLSLGVCQDVIASMDGDGDGGVSFEDFKLILSSLL